MASNEVKELLTVYEPGKIVRAARLGRLQDGGYMTPLDIAREIKGFMSYGISGDISYDRHLATISGANGFLFDHTIDGIPREDTRLKWFKMGVCSGHGSMADHLKLCGLNAAECALKMDVEGAEYDYFSTEELHPFKFIVIELHGLNGEGDHPVAKCLHRINEMFTLIHAHGNNWGPTVDGFPSSLECLYVRTDLCGKAGRNALRLPTKGDLPCKIDVPDLDLNFPPFVHASQKHPARSNLKVSPVPAWVRPYFAMRPRIEGYPIFQKVEDALVRYWNR